MTPTLNILLVMVTMSSADFTPDKMTILRNHGEDQIGCQLDARNLNAAHSWKKQKDGTSVRYECHPDNILPQQYTNQEKQEPGYAGALPVARDTSRVVTIRGGGATYRAYIPSY